MHSGVSTLFLVKLADEGGSISAENVVVQSIPANRAALFPLAIASYIVWLALHPAHVAAVRHQRA